LNALQILNAEFAPVTEEEWDSLSPQEVIDRVYQRRFAPTQLKVSGAGGEIRSYAYQTREGGFGLVRLTAVRTSTTHSAGPPLAKNSSCQGCRGNRPAHLDTTPDQLGGDTSLGSYRREEADACVLRPVYGPPRSLVSYPLAPSLPT